MNRSSGKNPAFASSKISFGYFTIGRIMTAGPKISLCAIVKNQAGLLGRLLEHHRDLFDEAVVVDTGSSDDSLAVAEAAGAVVDTFAWRDDFSAARNHGLDLATGDWILVLDCDELIAKDGFSGLRELVRAGRQAAFVLPQLNYFPVRRGIGWEPVGSENAPYCQNATGFVTAWSIRLFPNRPKLRYCGVVHESLQDRALAEGLDLERCETPIHHQGHLRGPEHRADRTGVNGHLLIRKLKDKPADPWARYEMAAHLAGTGKADLARKLLEQSLRDHPEWSDAFRAHLLLGEIRMNMGLKQEALAQYQAALEARPDWPACWEATIRGQLSLSRFQLAEQYLTQARQLFPRCPTWDLIDAQVSTSSGR